MSIRLLHREVLLRDRWYCSLPIAFAEPFMALSVPRRLEAGQRLCLRGQEHSGMWCLVGGVVHMLNHLQTDRDAFLDSFDPPMWFGELGFFDDGPFSHDVYAHTECSVLFFSRQKVRELLAAQPEFWTHLARLQAMKMRHAYFLLDEFSGMTTEVRLARRILAKAAHYGMRHGASDTVALRQEYLARSMGLVRASVARILLEWRRHGIVDLCYGGITICDFPELKRIARFGEWTSCYKEAFQLPVSPDEAWDLPPFEESDLDFPWIDAVN